MKVRDLLESQAYLPDWMRDHHAQKDVFKWIWRAVERRREQMKADGQGDYLVGMNWISAHIFVIDNFLWFMASHGYTLQRSRHRVDDFRAWDESIRRMKEEETAAFRLMLDEQDAAKREEAPHG